MGHPTRDGRGRFSGWTGSKKGRSPSRPRVAPRSGGTKVSKSRPASKPTTRTTKAKKFVKTNKKRIIIGGGTLAAVGAAGVVYNKKINPGTTLRKSGISIPGEVMRYGGKSSSRPEYTVVKSATHRFTTFSQKSGVKGIKKNQYTIVEKFDTRGRATTVGYVDSRRSLTGGYKVTHTYLTRANRGKGLGKQALAAHAAHRPRRVYRADVNRSTLGQGLAQSMGAAGRRSGKSKQHAEGITKALDYDWRTASKNIRTSHAKDVITATKGLSPHKTKAKVSTGRRLRR